MKNNLMQLVRLVAMVLAVAGIIYALEFMERGIAVWFWITLLGVGFVGLLYTFRLTQRRAARARREQERLEKKRSRRRRRCGTPQDGFSGAYGDDGGDGSCFRCRDDAFDCRKVLPDSVRFGFVPSGFLLPLYPV